MDLDRLRFDAEQQIAGRKAFEDHILGGRKSTKPLPKVELDPQEVLNMIDSIEARMAATEAALREAQATVQAQSGLTLSAHASTTLVSPHAKGDRAQDYGTQPFWQHDLTNRAIYEHITEDHGQIADMRGTSFVVSVAEDGLRVTVTPVASTGDTAADASAEAEDMSEVCGDYPAPCNHDDAEHSVRLGSRGQAV